MRFAAIFCPVILEILLFSNAKPRLGPPGPLAPLAGWPACGAGLVGPEENRLVVGLALDVQRIVPRTTLSQAVQRAHYQEIVSSPAATHVSVSTAEQSSSSACTIHSSISFPGIPPSCDTVFFDLLL